MQTIKKIILFFFILTNTLVYANSENKKTLVVILGETRGYELTYQNIKENLLDTVDADLAICIGASDDYPYENPFYQTAKYKFLYPEHADYGTAFDYAYQTIVQESPPIQDPIYWREFLTIKDQFLGGIKDPTNQHPGSAGILIFYRWFLLKNLIENNLLNKYDFFIITRSDYIYTLPHPEVTLFSHNLIYVPKGESYGGITDRHVVLPKKFVLPYLNILNNMVVRGQEYYNKMKNYKLWNLEQFIKFHLMQNDIFQYVRYFPYIMYTVRAPSGTTRWSTGVFSQEHNYFIKYPSEYDLANAEKADFIKQQLPIHKFYMQKIEP